MSTYKEQKKLNEEVHSEDLEHFIKSETECCMCATPLLSKHNVDYMTLQIHESLDCPNCKITLKNTTNTLH
ncbi:MAG: hypothetical protein IT287_05565 [Bdellovibrionaceae bacterium]|nr:hypothetical protein [Pseudobdellovibrionaceae bacterium]